MNPRRNKDKNLYKHRFSVGNFLICGLLQIKETAQSVQLEHQCRKLRQSVIRSIIQDVTKYFSKPLHIR